MNLINNRYRILKKISQNRLMSTYLVSDMMNNFQNIHLNIFNSESISESLLKFFIDEFVIFSNIIAENIVRVYDFDLVYFIDNKRTNNKQYFYTCSNYENNKTIIDLVQALQDEEILNIFIRICNVVNYLHLKGLVYGNLNINNILIDEDSENCSLKLKDIVTIYLEEYNYLGGVNKRDYFMAPELSRGVKPSKSSDIYSLGVLLLIILRRNAENNLDVKCEISNIKKQKLEDKLKENLLYHLISVIEKMVNENPDKRYDNVQEMVTDINYLIGTEYKVNKKEQIERLNFNTKVFGRKREIAEITNEYGLLNNNEKNKFILVHGDSGIGKTKFLKYIDKSLVLRKVNVYSSFSLDNPGINTNKAFIEILKKMLSESCEEIIERYQMELAKILPEIEAYKNNEEQQSLKSDKERLKLYSRIMGFIYEFVKEKNVVIVIDNLHLVSDFVFEILEYIYSRGLGGKKFMFVASYPEAECLENKKIIKFKKWVKENYDVIDINLQGLDKEDTADMVKSILGTEYIPKGLAARIYSETYGNPLLIQESLKEYFLKGLIYINEENGLWCINANEYNSVSISSSLEQFILNQINQIDDISYNVISIISIFNDSVGYETLTGFQLNVDEAKLDEVLNNLVGKGVLRKVSCEKGLYFEISNKALKNLIYNKIDELERMNKHRLAASILEKLHENEMYENKEELIYHLEEAGEKEKVVKYCMENAEKMIELNLNEAAIKSYKKALTMLPNALQERKKIELFIKIAKIYNKEGNSSLAIEYLERAADTAEENSEHIYYIDALNEIANIYSRKNETSKSLKCISKIESKLLKVEYIEGYLKAKQTEAAIYSWLEQYEKSYEICEKCIALCEDNYLSYKGILYNIIGNNYCFSAKPQEALEYYNKGMECLKRSGYIRGYLSILNNLAVIYGDYFQDNEKAIEYFNEMLEVSEKNNIVSMGIYALINLGATYSALYEYELARDYFKKGLKKATKYENEYNIFFCYANLMFLGLVTSNYSEAYEYYLLVEKEIKEYPDQGKQMDVYYQNLAELYYAFGELNKAKAFSEKALTVCEGTNILQSLEVKTLIACIDIYSKNSNKDIKETVNNIDEVIKGFDSDINKAYVLYTACIALYEKGYLQEVNQLVNTEYFKNGSVKSVRIATKEMYLRGVLGQGEEKVKFLKTALEYSKKMKDKTMQWKICDAIGDYYFSIKDYYYAVNYYFEACEIIKSLTKQIPKGFRVSYVNVFGILKPFNKILSMKKQNQYSNMDSFEDISLEIKNEKELEELFKYKDFIEILNNRYFIRSAKRIYKSVLPEEINGVKDIIKYFNEDAVKNLDIIGRYISSITLATRAMIIMDNNSMGLQVLAASNGNKEITDIEQTIRRVKDTKEAMIINKNFLQDNLEAVNDIKVAMCIPIILNGQEDHWKLKEERAKNAHTLKQVKGYLYVESERIVNNINEGSLKKCLDLVPLIGFTIDKHQCKIGSSIDKLTGALTRKFLEESLIEQLEKANTIGEKLSIIMFDLDNFKGINDSFGHQTGDQVLEDLCKIIMGAIRQQDLCGRYGGEEFIVILPNTGSQEALKVAERLRATVEKRRILGEKRSVTVSMGIATFPDQAQWQQELIEKADQALYVAKEKGRNRCEIWNSELSDKMKVNNQLSGIISGNPVQDSRRVLVIVQLVELIKAQMDSKDKIYNMLGRIIEITEAQNGILFMIEDDEIIEAYGRKNFAEGWIEIKGYNKDIISSVVTNKQGIYKIDWDDIVGYNSVTGMPDWQSVISVPLIKAGKVKGVLYLSASLKEKEFLFDDFNYVNTLGEIVIGVLG